MTSPQWWVVIYTLHMGVVRFLLAPSLPQTPHRSQHRLISVVPLGDAAVAYVPGDGVGAALVVVCAPPEADGA